MELPVPVVLLTIGALILFVAIIGWLSFRFGRKHALPSPEELLNLDNLGRRLLRSKLDIDALCEVLYWQVGQIVVTPNFQIGLFERESYLVRIWIKDNERRPPTEFPGGGTKGIVGWVRQTGRPLIVHDFEVERASLPAFPDFDLANPPRSGLFVPLIAEASTVGVLSIQSREPNQYNDHDLRILTIVANQAAWAIQNARLYERSQRSAEQLKLISHIATKISSLQSLPDLFMQLVTLTRDTFGYYCVSVFLNDQDRLVIGASTDATFYHACPTIEIGQGLIGWSARVQQTALANNVTEDPRYRELSILPQTESEIALPLMFENRLLGVLDVQGDRHDSFSDEDVFALETLAAQLALAIDQAGAFQNQRRLATRLEALVQVSQAIVSQLDLDDLFERVVSLISKAFGYKRVHIFLRTGDNIVFRSGVGPHSLRWMMDELQYELSETGLIAKVARMGSPELVHDVLLSQDYRIGPGLDDTRSEMVVPMTMAGNVLGVIDVQSEQVNAFTRDDLILMQALADSVAVSIRNAALYLNERKRSKLAETLHSISSVITSNLDLDRVLAAILDGLSRVVSLDAAAILLGEGDAKYLTIVATLGSELDSAVGRHLSLKFPDSAAGVIEEEVERAYHEILQLPVGHSCLTTPLWVGSSLIGYLIADRFSVGQFGENDADLINAFANQAAVAINNARLYSAQQSEAWITTALLQVAEAVKALANIDETLETIARLATLLGGVNQCVILRYQSELRQFSVIAAYPTVESASARLIAAESHPYFELLCLADRPLGAGSGHQLSKPEILDALIKGSEVLGFPLAVKDEVLGALIVDAVREGKDSDTRTHNILTGIAHQTAMVLETDVLQRRAADQDRLEQELRVAHQIQATFIPHSPPQQPDWDMAASWRAVRQVSGDFYDFIPLKDRSWGLVIADVADKGMPAALFMAMCRTLIRAAAINRSSPAETLVRVNELLFNDSDSNLFVTVFYAICNYHTADIIYSCAGHNPPLLMRGKNRSIKELRRGGVALGVLPEITLHETRIRMQEGDLLLAYTDGITEAMDSNKSEWGLSRFKRALRETNNGSAQETLDHVLHSVDRFVNHAPQSDDIALWVLKRL